MHVTYPPLRPVNAVDDDLLFELCLSISACKSSDAAGLAWAALRTANFAKLPVRFDAEFCCCLHDQQTSLEFRFEFPFVIKMRKRDTSLCLEIKDKNISVNHSNLKLPIKYFWPDPVSMSLTWAQSHILTIQINRSTPL